MKKRVKNPKKIVKGTRSAVVLSVLIHAALFFLAGVLVVFTVVRKEEQRFIPPKEAERPRMKLKKPKVKIKKSTRPNTTRIVTQSPKASMPDIDLPELGGMGAGLNEGFDGLELMPSIGEVTVFGSGHSIGNDFSGSFYNFNRDRAGRNIPMSTDMFMQKISDFVRSGWKTSTISQYHRSPNKLYTTHFMIPPVISQLGPDSFGEEDAEGYCWLAHYKGKLVHKDGIRFRFRGHGDEVIVVRVDGEIVLIGTWPGRIDTYFSSLWQTSSAESRTYYLGNNRSVVGDWITLEPGVPLDMEVMIAEVYGGGFCAMLTVEVEGVEYEKNKQNGPILPMFKTAEPSRDLLDILYRELVFEEASVTNGPVFCDYDVSGGAAAVTPPEPRTTEVKPDIDDLAIRTWERADGTSFDAAFVMMVGDKAVLKHTNGESRKVALKELSDTDRTFVELAQPPIFNIDFSKKTTQFMDKMSPYHNRFPPKVIDYVFSARLRQTSPNMYNHEVHVEFFAIGAENFGDRFVLLDHRESRFTPALTDNKSHTFSGDAVRLITYEMNGDFKGNKYASYLVVVTDSRGQIIAHQTPNEWLFDNLSNLKQLPAGSYFNESCERVFPTRPTTNRY